MPTPESYVTDSTGGPRMSEQVTFPISPVLESYDWNEAFKYAEQARIPGSGGEQIPGFTTADVAEVLAWWAQSDGSERERYYGELELVAVFRLRDGRYASLDAWCDTSGWGCQENGHAYIADTLDEIIQQGLTDEYRDRLAGQLP